MSWPSKTIVPDVGSISFMIVRPSVVFPHPDSPTTPRVSPGRTLSSRRRRREPARPCVEEPGLDREVLDEVLDAEEIVAVRRRCGRGRLGNGGLPSASRSPRIRRCRPRSANEPQRALPRSGTPTDDRPAIVASPSAGISVRHTARPCEWTQRGWNAHPGGGLMRLGGWPGIGSSRSWSMSTRARLFMSPIVYG